MKKTLGAVATAILICFPTYAYADAILVNGSFELGPPIPTADINILGGSTAITGWTVTGSRIDYLASPWDVSDGARAIDLDGNDAIGGIEQTFSTWLGVTYLVFFDLSGNPQGGPTVKSLRVTVDGFTQDYAFDTTGQTRENLIWQPISFSFVASGPSATLSFASLSPSNNSYGTLIDNVRVNTVPEPATAWLVGFGFAVAALLRGRKSLSRRPRTQFEPSILWASH